MATFRVERNKNYTSMANYHFLDKSLSWKAKGILSNMLSLPDDWDYSLAGLVTLSSDGMSATRSAIKELEEHGYLIRRPIRKDGKISDWEYLIFENPQVANQYEEKQVVENQQVENQTQYITKELNTKKQSTKELSTKKGKRKTAFIPPTVEQVQAYCQERKNSVNAQKFINYYASKGWMVGKTKMVDWKAAVRTWEQNGFDTGKQYGANGVAINRSGANDLDDIF